MNRLADIDLMLATPDGDALLLIEIEERPLSPKKLLGDLFALLLCDRVAVRAGMKQRYFHITPQTKLIVVGITPPKGQQRAKFESVIFPRVREASGPPGSIPLDNVSLLLGDTLDHAIERLKEELRPYY